uniref:Outer dense fiber protein 2 n=1 Tax=Arion vulgaris TaxID=1028688 RepID=A0A0B6ZZI0_9EUPU
MTRERGLTPSLPAHSEDIVGHVHVKKCKKKNTSAKTAGGQRLLRPTVSSRARARSVSPKSGPWVPAPGKATRGGRITWQGTGQRSEVNHVRNSDLSTDEEERFGGEVRKYEKKINNLINEVGTLRNEVVLQKALQEIEQKEDLLNTSSRMLQHHEDELEHVQEELHQVEAELVVSESENKLLRKNMELIAEEAEITKTQKEQLNYERERLMKKLIEAELDGQAASHQVIELRDLIRQLRDEQRISSVDQARLSKQKDLFLKALADFEATNRALQHLLRDQHRLEASGMRMSEQRDILLRKLADCDLMNERMNNQLLDCESLIADLKSQLQVEKEERLVLSNLQGSLESTRGHLQKQLRTKEADCNRMSVQIRSLEGQLSQERMEKDHFQEVASSLKHKTDRDKEALKKAARRITELEALLDRMEDTAKSQNDSLTVRLHEKIAENAGLKLECERLKVSRVRIDGGESNTRVEEKERLQRDGEQELEKVKQRLHQRLQELEPLPELLRATELRLQEANEKVVSHEKRNIENTRIIAELTAKLDCNSESLDQFRSRCSDSQDSNRSLQSKYETLERRLRELEEKNLELHASQVKLQESLHQESMRLEEKARENASLTRQLENALTDGRKHNEQSRDRYLTKERTYQSRIVDLESQLSQMRADQTRLKREKEENERKFNARLYDLKDRLEQCQSSNRSMQNYVQFLKNSYSNVFGDTASSLPSPISPVKPYP